MKPNFFDTFEYFKYSNFMSDFTDQFNIIFINIQFS